MKSKINKLKKTIEKLQSRSFHCLLIGRVSFIGRYVDSFENTEAEAGRRQAVG